MLTNQRLVDIFMISETRTDDSFPQARYLVEGFLSPFIFDPDKTGGGIFQKFQLKYYAMIFPLLKAFLSKLFFIKRSDLLIAHIIRIRTASKIILKLLAEH